ncbi:MAG: GCN5-related N-acetyltransferase [Candidatus Eremiobacteraeota bacterium]|nr:GCN5-related N-acetyltransferase [Candidatus Eremiobacteraeota bacterium]
MCGGKRAPMLLRGRLVRLRAIESSDFETWRSWINRPDVMEGMDRAVIATAAQHKRYVETAVADDRAVFLAVETLEAERLSGIVWLWDVDHRHRRAEVRIVIGDPEARGRGFGTDALEALATYAFGTLRLRKLYAYIHASNEASRRAFERAGFALEVTLEREAYRNGCETDVHRMRRFADERHD